MCLIHKNAKEQISAKKEIYNAIRCKVDFDGLRINFAQDCIMRLNSLYKTRAQNHGEM